MPELPEVEVVKLGLKGLLIGHKITEIEILNATSWHGDSKDLKRLLYGCQITDVKRLGKVVLIMLNQDYLLAIHLKMTGQLVYTQSRLDGDNQHFGGGHPSDSLIKTLPDKSTRVILHLSQNSKLFFNDLRKFGWIKWLPQSQINQIDFLRKLGPDALQITASEFVKRLHKRSKCIKACLLDQEIMAGCGNIYADESLWKAQIHPQTSARNLTISQLKLLLQSLKQVLTLSIKCGGSSSRNYIDALGNKGTYLKSCFVYQKTGQSCQRCGNLISRIVVAGRGTHICNFCQILKLGSDVQ